MRILVLAMCFMIWETAGWGQAPPNPDPAARKVDRATSYYHYALARMYLRMAAASRIRGREYLNLAIENYKLAIQADPHTPMLSEELAVLEGGRPRPISSAPMLGR
jgi:hypothetical protein